MKEHNTFPGKTYVVTSKAGCTITDASGELEETCEPGKQKAISAPSDKLYTSEHAVVRETFNRAALALGQSGGGVKSELPPGFVAADFAVIENEFLIPCGIYDTTLSSTLELSAKIQRLTAGEDEWLSLFGYYINENCYKRIAIGGKKYNEKYHDVWAVRGKNKSSIASVYQCSVDFGKVNNLIYAGDTVKINGVVYSSPVKGDTPYACREVFVNRPNKCARMELHKAVFSFNGVKWVDLRPCVTFQRKSCIYNVVDGAQYQHKCVLGFTLQRARTLGERLPAGGGSLTISVPTGYEQDAGVADSLEAARAKGWTLTVQTYEAEAAIATFGMRRVWVRRTQDEHGGYVDADGVRWSVDWCVDMLTPDGSTPDMHGYELYRSTEAAVAYWELAPWVEPEDEKLLTTESL